jgi:hypothetical protein
MRKTLAYLLHLKKTRDLLNMIKNMCLQTVHLLRIAVILAIKSKKSGLAIVAMQHISRRPLQSQECKKKGILDFFLCGMLQRPFDPSPPLTMPT